MYSIWTAERDSAPNEISLLSEIDILMVMWIKWGGGGAFNPTQLLFYHNFKQIDLSYSIMF